MPSRSSLARLQQAIVLALVAGALAWGLHWWPQRPVVAVAGGLAILWAHAWFLALEMALAAMVSRSDATQAPGAAARVRAWWRETLEGPRVFGWRQPFRWRAVPDTLQGRPGRRGIVFVHGFVCNRGFWAPWMRRCQAEGTPCIAVNLEPVFGPIDGYAPTLDRAVAQLTAATGLPPVLVCHSMGGLAARAWLRSRSGPVPVAHVVTIGTPHRGAWLARLSHLANGRQMRIGGDWLRELAAGETAQPGLYTCWYADCDNIVFPPSTATLSHADNRLVRGAAHVDMAFHPQVVDGTLALVASL